MSTTTTGQALRTRLTLPVRLRRWSLFNIAAVLAGLAIAAAVLYPVLIVISRAFLPEGQLTLSPFREVFADPALTQVLLNTLVVVVTSTVLAVLIAGAFAWLNERTDARVGWLARVLPLAPLLVPGAAAAVGWLSLLSPRTGLVNVLLRGAFGIEGGEGPLNVTSLPGLVVLYTIALMPIAYVILQPAFQNLDPALEEAARVSGAGPAFSLFRIALPAISPALTSAVLLTGVIGLSIFSIPALVGTQAKIDVIATRIYSDLTYSYPPMTGRALVLSLVILTATLVALAGQRWVVRRGRHAAIAGKRSGSSLVRLGRLRLLARGLMIAYLVMCALIPFLGLIYLSFQRFWSAQVSFAFVGVNYAEVFGAGTETEQAVVNSAVLGMVSATLAIAAATLIATYVHRSRSVLARIVDGTTKLPATVSQLVLAVGVLLAFSGVPFELSGTHTILILGYVLLYFALASFAANSAISQISTELTEAASVNGARSGRTFLRIQLPLMAPTLLGGWVLVFISTIGDVTVGALLAGTNSPVVGFSILNLQANGSYTQLAALGVVMTLTSGFVVLVTAVLVKRGGLNLRGQAGVGGS